MLWIDIAIVLAMVALLVVMLWPSRTCHNCGKKMKRKGTVVRGRIYYHYFKCPRCNHDEYVEV